MSEKTKQLPPIRALFAESWETLTASLQPVLILNICTIVVFALMALLATFILILSGIGTLFFKTALTASSAESFFNSIPENTFLILWIVLMIVILAYIFVQSAITTTVVLVFDSKGKIALPEAFRKGLGLVIPLALVGFLTSFLIMGSFFVFILPGIFIAMLLMFTGYEMILNDQRLLGAIKRSATIVSANFGSLFVRALAIGIVYVGIGFIIPNILDSAGSHVKLYINFFSFFANWLLGWYVSAYMVTLYKQARQQVDHTKAKSIAWMFFISILGWLILAGIIYTVFSHFPHLPNKIV